ncbi:MAG: NAD(P)/FAD-dependent oxidoreductase [Clostridia bacterium]|nr:NAD(P)/FAD-dependent oxidoreductase [Clostridia bacterium]
MYDVAIIGAGVVGGMIARELSRYKLNICIIERAADVAMGATKANSAIVHAGYDAANGSLKARLNVRGSQMMEQIANQLGVSYRRNGSIVVGFSAEDRNTLLGLIERGERNGVRDLQLLEREQLLAIEPNIGEDVLCALYAPTGAIICPYGLCIAAIGNAMDNGAELMLDSEVTDIERAEGGYSVVINGERRVVTRYVINCAGVYSDKIAGMVGDESFRITPRRGEYMILDKECGSLVNSTVFRCPSKMGKGILVSPTVDGNLILGPTAEDIEDKDDLSTTAEGVGAVRRQASEQVSGINYGKVITSFSGIRSTGSTGDFIINFPVKGFLNVAGIESPGLSASPAIAEYVAEMLRNDGLTMEAKEDFDPIRRPMHYYKNLSVPEKNALIKERPEYAHVICRCETVTEGEIIDAIRANPKPRDVDGVKRRTRSGMGRCQGGFCAPYIVDILARELGCDYGEITKFGGDSLINVGKTKN